jgi:16S rRNA (guanine1207-N2)-methyltransferase
MHDPVLDTLFLPLETGRIDWPQQALFLRARMGLAMREIPKDKLVCEQSFRTQYEALERSGFKVREDDDTKDFPLTLILPPRQRDENRALLARAVTRTKKGGIVLASVSNLEGAKTVEADLAALTGNISSLSKNKCRAFWSEIGNSLDQTLIDTWLKLDAPRKILDGRYLSRPGLFAWDRLDAGSQYLMKHLPKLSGTGADLGSGFGYLSDEILKQSDVTRIDLYEAEGRALKLSKDNLKPYGARASFHWQDVTKGGIGPYDFIVANPPFHTDRADRTELGQAFIRRASEALNVGGVFYMVANRHLPYEATLRSAFKTVVMLGDDGAYKVYKAIK